jgi:hypothetical protein
MHDIPSVIGYVDRKYDFSVWQEDHYKSRTSAWFGILRRERGFLSLSFAALDNDVGSEYRKLVNCADEQNAAI